MRRNRRPSHVVRSRLEFIKLRGLLAGAQTSLQLQFYSPDIPLPLILIEVTGAEQVAAAMRQTL